MPPCGCKSTNYRSNQDAACICSLRFDKISRQGGYCPGAPRLDRNPAPVRCCCAQCVVAVAHVQNVRSIGLVCLLVVGLWQCELRGGPEWEDGFEKMTLTHRFAVRCGMAAVHVVSTPGNCSASLPLDSYLTRFRHKRVAVLTEPLESTAWKLLRAVPTRHPLPHVYPQSVLHYGCRESLLAAS